MARPKFIVDESTGTAVVEHLRQQQYDVLFVSEEMPQATDTEILELATKDRRIVVTNDKDFGELVYHRGKAHAGVILLRLNDESSANRVRVIQAILTNYIDKIPGNFVVATERKLRIRASKLK